MFLNIDDDDYDDVGEFIKSRTRLGPIEAAIIYITVCFLKREVEI